MSTISSSRPMSRRDFLLRGGAGLGGLMLGPSLLAACGTVGVGQKAVGADGAKELTFSNWDAYIDEDDNGAVDGKGTTIAEFQKATGIKMTYHKDYNDNDEYFNKIYSPLLGRGKRLDADITTPTFWMAARLVRLGWTEKLPLDEIPNHKNLDEAYLGLAWDEGAKHHMPWQGGLTGIAWNPKLVGGDLHSVDDLYDKKLKGKVSFMTEWRDSIGMTMFTDGADPAKSDIGAMHKAIDKIDKARSDGQILKFTGNEYLRGLENGDLAACLAWSGDIAQLDPELGIKFAIPDEGGMQWFDTMTIPKGSKNRVAAARWMNYVYDPEHAAKITEFVQYVTPVKGVKEVLADAGGDAAELADNPLIFPDDETASRLKVFADLKQKDEADIEKRFSEVSG